MFKHILIATDGSAVSNKAAKAGIALALALDAKVTAYCAIEDQLPIYSEGYAFDQVTIDRPERRRTGKRDHLPGMQCGKAGSHADRRLPMVL